MTATTSRTGLHAPMGWRAGFASAAFFFLVGFLGNVASAVAGGFTWDLAHVVAALLTGVAAVASTYAAAAAFMNRVWYDAATNTLQQRVVLFDVERRLNRPTTVEFACKRSFLCPAGFWTVTVRTDGLPPLVLSTPWSGSVEDVARMLRPAFHRNLDLPHDEFSRQVLIDPSALGKETGPQSGPVADAA